MKRILIGLVVAFLLVEPICGAEILPSASERFSRDDGESASFRRHVAPLLGRLGCNGRACHGSFQGQGGFRLSLFGYDFDMDHAALTSGGASRVDKKDPVSSLILEKPTLTQSHKGGKRLEKGGWQYRLLLRWIRDGAKNDAPQSARLERLSVTPSQWVVAKPGPQVQLQVVAHWSDGTAEDVTALSRFRSNDDAIATVSEAGLTTAIGTGDTHVVAFYDKGVVPVQVVVPVSDRIGPRYPDVPTPTPVDELVVAKLRQLGVVPSELAGDAEFLRRVSLDLTGTLPTPSEIEAFLADPSSDKRTRKIDELLARPTYAAWWTTRLCDLTGNNGQYREVAFRQEFRRQWYDWIYRRVQDNVGYDRLVAGIVLAIGRRPGQSLENYFEEMSSYLRKDKPADYAQRETLPLYWSRQIFDSPDERALGVSHNFLGIRLQCARCHKHPFDQWTKKDFEDFTAFFRPITYGTPPADREAYAKLTASMTAGAVKGKAGAVEANLAREGKTVPWREVYVGKAGDNGGKKGEKFQPKKGVADKPVVARLLGGETKSLAPGTDPREAVMEWLRRPDNPYFARAFVNRVWAAYFNAGIVDPPDDLNLANPPSNPALLDYLTREFISHGYDMKWLHRTIVTSRTYQLSWKPNETNRQDLRNFSHALPRRLPAEVALDALTQATAGPEELAAWSRDLSKHTIAQETEVFTKGKGRSGSILRVFGRPDRISDCDCERSNQPSLMQTMFLFNDGEMLGLVDRPGGWVSQLTQQLLPPLPAGKGGKQAVADRREDAVRAGVIANLRRRIQELRAQGKNEDAAELKRVAMAIRQSPPADPTPGATERKPMGPEEENRVIREAYLRTVSRPPTSAETARARAYLHESESLPAGVRDLLWALLNTKEFIVNH
jgi:hypothetical protein